MVNPIHIEYVLIHIGFHAEYAEYKNVSIEVKNTKSLQINRTMIFPVKVNGDPNTAYAEWLCTFLLKKVIAKTQVK